MLFVLLLNISDLIVSPQMAFLANLKVLEKFIKVSGTKW